MKKLLVAIAIALGTFWSAPVEAQTYLRNTTLSANITATQTQIRIASATGVEAGGALFIDHEYMPILSVSGTTVTVARIQKPAAHASAAVVYIATSAQRPAVMLNTNGAQRAGQCSTSTVSGASESLSAYQFLPIIDIDTGDFYNCRRNGTGGTWVWVRTNVQSFNGEAGSLPTAWP